MFLITQDLRVNVQLIKGELYDGHLTTILIYFMYFPIIK
jgi:hypothetical protein